MYPLVLSPYAIPEDWKRVHKVLKSCVPFQQAFANGHLSKPTVKGGTSYLKR